METAKLKLEKFVSIKEVNFPKGIKTGLNSSGDNTDVIIYYIDKIDDVENFVKLCRNSNLPEDNRTIMVYKKGRNDGVNRDNIITPFKENKYPEFKLKAPMLCSLSKDYSAFVMCLTL